jgi:hypothetical protein
VAPCRAKFFLLFWCSDITESYSKLWQGHVRDLTRFGRSSIEEQVVRFGASRGQES